MKESVFVFIIPNLSEQYVKEKIYEMMSVFDGTGIELDVEYATLENVYVSVHRKVKI